MGKSAMKTHKKRLFVTDGRDVPLKGVALYFVRTNNTVMLTNDNIADVTFILFTSRLKISKLIFLLKMTCFNMLDPSEAGGVLGAIKNQYRDLFLPALKRMDKGWGDLSGESGEKERSKFINDIENFCQVLDSASSSSNTIQLSPCTTFDLSVLKSANDFYNVANSFESMEKIEACMAVWIKQIAQVN